MITDEQKQEFLTICESLKNKYSWIDGTFTVTPYFSYDSSKVFIHIHKYIYIDFKNGYSSSFTDTWFLESPAFYPRFIGKPEKVTTIHKDVLCLGKKSAELFKTFTHPTESTAE